MQIFPPPDAGAGVPHPEILLPDFIPVSKSTDMTDQVARIKAALRFSAKETFNVTLQRTESGAPFETVCCKRS